MTPSPMGPWRSGTGPTGTGAPAEPMSEPAAPRPADRRVGDRVDVGRTADPRRGARMAGSTRGRSGGGGRDAPVVPAPHGSHRPGPSAVASMVLEPWCLLAHGRGGPDRRRRGPQRDRRGCSTRNGGCRSASPRSSRCSVAFVVRSSNYRSLMFRAVRDDQSRAGVPASPPHGETRLSVVVPAYGEARPDRRRPWRGSATSWPHVEADGGLEIVVVDDGSHDGTADAARGRRRGQVLQLPRRTAARVPRCAPACSPRRGRTVAFTDADLSYTPEQIVRLLEAVEAGWDVVVGQPPTHRHADRRPCGSPPRARGADRSTSSPASCCSVATATPSAA